MFRLSRVRVLSLVNQKNDKIGPPIPHTSVTAANNRIFRRNWVFRNEKWCSLCNEPIAVWAAHSGRRDHTLQEGTYSGFVDYPRTWDTEEVFRTFESSLGHDVGIYHRKYAFEQEGTRRSELLAMLCYLRDRQLIQCKVPADSWVRYYAPSLFGYNWAPEVALRRYVTATLLRLYPYGEISTLSGFMDFITVSYNLESVYDLCGFSEIDPNGSTMSISSPLAYGLTWSTASTKDSEGSSSTSTQSPVAQAAAEAAAALAERERLEAAEAEKALLGEGVPEEDEKDDLDGGDDSGGDGRGFDNTHAKKANFVRGILAQLRFTLEAGSGGAKPHPWPHAMGKQKKLTDHDVLVMELCCRYIVAEAITCRSIEYSTRVEAVWVREGFERATRNFKDLSNSEAGTRGTEPTPGFETTDYMPRAKNLNQHYFSADWRDMGDSEFRKKFSSGGSGSIGGLSPPPPPSGGQSSTKVSVGPKGATPIAAPLPPRAAILGKILGTSKQVTTLPSPDSLTNDSPAARAAKKARDLKAKEQMEAMMSFKLKKRLAARKEAAKEKKRLSASLSGHSHHQGRAGGRVVRLDHTSEFLGKNKKLLQWEKAGVEIPAWVGSGAKEAVSSYQDLMKAYLEDHNGTATPESVVNIGGERDDMTH